MAKTPKVKPKRTPVERLLDRLTRARLCFGDPVSSGDHTVIPVARVRVAGGLGYGDSDGGGGGGGGTLDARPVGFIEIGPEGAHYERIPDRHLLATAVAAAAFVAGWRVNHLLRR